MGTYGFVAPSVRDLARTSEGNLHCVYNHTPDINYAKSTDGGSNWSITTIASSYENYTPTIAVDSNNHIHVVWQVKNDSAYYLYYKKSTDGGSTWGQTLGLASTDNESIEHPTIAIDSNNYIHIVWNQFTSVNNNHQLMYRKSIDGGSTWSSTSTLTSGTYAHQKPVLAVDSNDNIHIVCEKTYSDYYVSYLVSIDNGSTWSIVDITSTTDSYIEPCIAIDINDTLHVVWRDTDIYYSKSTDNGSTWSTPTVIYSDGTACWYPSISITGDNTLHVAWKCDSSPARLKHISSTDGGSTWGTADELTSYDEGYIDFKPSLIWAMWPKVYGARTNWPSYGFGLIYEKNIDPDVFYYASLLEFVTGGIYEASGIIISGGEAITYREGYRHYEGSGLIQISGDAEEYYWASFSYEGNGVILVAGNAVTEGYKIREYIGSGLILTSGVAKSSAWGTITCGEEINLEESPGITRYKEVHLSFKDPEGAAYIIEALKEADDGGSCDLGFENDWWVEPVSNESGYDFIGSTVKDPLTDLAAFHLHSRDAVIIYNVKTKSKVGSVVDEDNFIDGKVCKTIGFYNNKIDLISTTSENYGKFLSYIVDGSYVENIGYNVVSEINLSPFGAFIFSEINLYDIGIVSETILNSDTYLESEIFIFDFDGLNSEIDLFSFVFDKTYDKIASYDDWFIVGKCDLGSSLNEKIFAVYKIDRNTYKILASKFFYIDGVKQETLATYDDSSPVYLETLEEYDLAIYEKTPGDIRIAIARGGHIYDCPDANDYGTVWEIYDENLENGELIWLERTSFKSKKPRGWWFGEAWKDKYYLNVEIFEYFNSDPGDPIYYDELLVIKNGSKLYESIYPFKQTQTTDPARFDSNYLFNIEDTYTYDYVDSEILLNQDREAVNSELILWIEELSSGLDAEVPIIPEFKVGAGSEILLLQDFCLNSKLPLDTDTNIESIINLVNKEEIPVYLLFAHTSEDSIAGDYEQLQYNPTTQTIFLFNSGISDYFTRSLDNIPYCLNENYLYLIYAPNDGTDHKNLRILDYGTMELLSESTIDSITNLSLPLHPSLTYGDSRLWTIVYKYSYDQINQRDLYTYYLVQIWPDTGDNFYIKIDDILKDYVDITLNDQYRIRLDFVVSDGSYLYTTFTFMEYNYSNSLSGYYIAKLNFDLTVESITKIFDHLIPPDSVENAVLTKIIDAAENKIIFDGNISALQKMWISSSYTAYNNYTFYRTLLVDISNNNKILLKGKYPYNAPPYNGGVFVGDYGNESILTYYETPDGKVICLMNLKGEIIKIIDDNFSTAISQYVTKSYYTIEPYIQSEMRLLAYSYTPSTPTSPSAPTSITKVQDI